MIFLLESFFISWLVISINFKAKLLRFYYLHYYNFYLNILIEQIYPPLTATVNHAPVTAYFFEDTVGYLCNATKPKPTSSVTDGNLHFGADAKSYGQCEKWIVYSNTPASFTSRVPYYLPVSLYDPLFDTYSMGLMTVWTYS